MDLITIINTVTTIVTVASIIAASTPTPKDDEWIAKLYKFIDLLAINIGKAKQQVKLDMAAKTEMELALEALDKIAQHEKECGERWGEATAELRQLKELAMSHAARWEKLSWLVVTVVITGAASVIVAHLG